MTGSNYSVRRTEALRSYRASKPSCSLLLDPLDPQDLQASRDRLALLRILAQQERQVRQDQRERRDLLGLLGRLGQQATLDQQAQLVLPARSRDRLGILVQQGLPERPERRALHLRLLGLLVPPALQDRAALRRTLVLLALLGLLALTARLVLQDQLALPGLPQIRVQPVTQGQQERPERLVPLVRPGLREQPVRRERPPQSQGLLDRPDLLARLAQQVLLPDPPDQPGRQASLARLAAQVLQELQERQALARPPI